MTCSWGCWKGRIAAWIAAWWRLWRLWRRHSVLTLELRCLPVLLAHRNPSARTPWPPLCGGCPWGQGGAGGCCRGEIKNGGKGRALFRGLRQDTEPSRRQESIGQGSSSIGWVFEEICRKTHRPPRHRCRLQGGYSRGSLGGTSPVPLHPGVCMSSHLCSQWSSQCNYLATPKPNLQLC